jgi:DNA-directed RNA polymerase sigma subunit (sigma70/sigma32)
MELAAELGHVGSNSSVLVRGIGCDRAATRQDRLTASLKHTSAEDVGVTDTLQCYLGEIGGCERLRAEEECEVAAAIARGDPEARNRMIRANL